MARDHSRFRKLLQVQRHHLVNAESAVRWWAQFDVFHFFTSVPIHTAVASLLLSSSTFRNFNHLSILASLSAFSATHELHTTMSFSQSRHMGFATVWRKRRRLRLLVALRQAFLAKRMNNRLDLWRLLDDLGSNTLHTEQGLPTRCLVHPPPHRHTLA